VDEQGRTAVLAWQRTIDAAWQQQSALLTGAAGGPLSAEQRDTANRALLAREKAALLAERERLSKQIGESLDEYPPELARLDEIDVKLGDIAVIEGRLNQPPDPANVDGTQYYLLDFSTNGPGQDITAVVAHGNPDTAANVATYVPGTEFSRPPMDSLMRESDAMYASANRHGTNSSVITWLGYDAPDSIAHAISPAYAIDASAALDRFQQDLRAANPDAHLTVVGYSYGSVVTGYAAKDGGLVADDILAIGSPGMAVSTAAELGVPPERVWVLEANGDPVADTQAHGYDPGDDRFGANQLPADPEGRRPTTLGDISIDAHLNYFYDTPQTRPSYENIGDVIANRPPSHR
jgi:hypothetical protein